MSLSKGRPPSPSLGPALPHHEPTQLAADLLGFARVEVANLFAESSQTTNEIALLGATESGWLSARQSLMDCITGAEGVLLAYGAAEPTGTARAHFRSQIEWLRDRIATSRLPVWQVGDGPRDPSRWQRWTIQRILESPSLRR